MKILTPEEVLRDLATLPQDYKTADVDRLIKGYIAVDADVSLLREYILTRQELHRIYFFVSLKQMPSAEERMAFIHGNLLLSDWWHTDQLIGFVADLSFDAALAYAKEYINAFSFADDSQRAVVKVILGKIPAQGKNPVD